MNMFNRLLSVMVLPVIFSPFIAGQKRMYFKPFVFVDSVNLNENKLRHNRYFIIEKVNDSTDVEYIVSCKNDSVIGKFTYRINNDTTWKEPIRKAIMELENEIRTTNDKGRKKHNQSKIAWLKERYDINK